MKAVVTGADGFAGRWLCRALVGCGIETEGWLRKASADPLGGVEYQRVDICDFGNLKGAMEKADPDLVFHLAALTNPADCDAHPALAAAINIEGTQHVFRAMPASARGLFSSSCHAYGEAKGRVLLESMQCQPVGVYAETKLEAERWIQESGRPVVIARAFHHTGPEQSTRYALADWCSQIKQGASQITVGNITVERDYTDVRDIVEGYRLLAENGVAGEVYNLCSGKAHTLGQFIKWAVGDRAVNVRVDPERLRPNDAPIIVGSSEKANALGWTPSHSMQDTLAAMAR